MAKDQQEIKTEMDKRLIDHRLLRGLMGEEELSELLEALPDVSDNAEEVLIPLEERK